MSLSMQDRLRILRETTPTPAPTGYDVPAWKDRYTTAHGFRPGEGNEEDEVDAGANLLWSLDFRRQFGRDPDDEDYRAHFVEYTTTDEGRAAFERYRELSRQMLGGASEPPIAGSGSKQDKPFGGSPNEEMGPYDVEVRQNSPRTGTATRRNNGSRSTNQGPSDPQVDRETLPITSLPGSSGKPSWAIEGQGYYDPNRGTYVPPDESRTGRTATPPPTVVQPDPDTTIQRQEAAPPRKSNVPVPKKQSRGNLPEEADRAGSTPPASPTHTPRSTRNLPEDVTIPSVPSTTTPSSPTPPQGGRRVYDSRHGRRADNGGSTAVRTDVSTSTHTPSFVQPSTATAPVTSEPENLAQPSFLDRARMYGSALFDTVADPIRDAMANRPAGGYNIIEHGWRGIPLPGGSTAGDVNDALSAMGGVGVAGSSAVSLTALDHNLRSQGMTPLTPQETQIFLRNNIAAVDLARDPERAVEAISRIRQGENPEHVFAEYRGWLSGVGEVIYDPLNLAEGAIGVTRAPSFVTDGVADDIARNLNRTGLTDDILIVDQPQPGPYSFSIRDNLRSPFPRGDELDRAAAELDRAELPPFLRRTNPFLPSADEFDELDDVASPPFVRRRDARVTPPGTQRNTTQTVPEVGTRVSTFQGDGEVVAVLPNASNQSQRVRVRFDDGTVKTVQGTSINRVSPPQTTTSNRGVTTSNPPATASRTSNAAPTVSNVVPSPLPQQADRLNQSIREGNPNDIADLERQFMEVRGYRVDPTTRQVVDMEGNPILREDGKPMFDRRISVKQKFMREHGLTDDGVSRWSSELRSRYADVLRQHITEGSQESGITPLPGRPFSMEASGQMVQEQLGILQADLDNLARGNFTGQYKNRESLERAIIGRASQMNDASRGTYRVVMTVQQDGRIVADFVPAAQATTSAPSFMQSPPGVNGIRQAADRPATSSRGHGVEPSEAELLDELWGSDVATPGTQGRNEQLTNFPETLTQAATRPRVQVVEPAPAQGTRQGLITPAVKAVGKTFAVGATVGTVGTGAGLALTLTTSAGETLLERDDQGNARGYLAEKIDEGLQVASEQGAWQNLKENAFWTILDGVSQPAYWAEQMGSMGLAALATNDMARSFLHATGMPLFQNPEEVAWHKQMMNDPFLTDRERQAYFESFRVAYSGYGYQRQAYEAILAEENPTPERLTEILQEYQNPLAELAGQMLVDPMGVVNAGLVTRPLGRLAGVGNEASSLQRWREVHRMREALGEVNRLLDSGGRGIGRVLALGDWLRTPMAKFERDLADTISQVQGRMVGANATEVLDNLEHFFTGASAGTETGRGITSELAGLNWPTLRHTITRRLGASTSAEQAQNIALNLISDTLRPIYRARYGESGPLVQGVESISRLQKNLLYWPLLKTSPRYWIRNEINNAFTALIDGRFSNHSGDAVLEFFKKEVGVVPQSLVGDAFDIAGMHKPNGREQLARMRVFHDAFLDWYPVLWERGLRGAQRAFSAAGLTPPQVDELVGILAGSFNERHMGARAHAWGARSGIAPAQIDGLLQTLEPLMQRTRSAVFQGAKEATDFSLLNYRDRTVLDAFAELRSPYQFWQTRSILHWSQRLLDNPAVFAGYARMEDAIREKLNEGLNDPAYLQGDISLPTSANPYLGEAVAHQLDSLIIASGLQSEEDIQDGYGLYVNALRVINPIEDIAEFMPGVGYEEQMEQSEDEWVRNFVTANSLLPGSESPLFHATVSLIDMMNGGEYNLRQHFEPTTPLAMEPMIDVLSGEFLGENLSFTPAYRRLLGYQADAPSWVEARSVGEVADRMRTGEYSPEQGYEAAAFRNTLPWRSANDRMSDWFATRGAVSYLTGFLPRAEPHGQLRGESGDYQRQRAEMVQRYGENSSEVREWQRDYFQAHPEMSVYYNRYDPQDDSLNAYSRSVPSDYLRYELQDRIAAQVAQYARENMNDDGLAGLVESYRTRGRLLFQTLAEANATPAHERSDEQRRLVQAFDDSGMLRSALAYNAVMTGDATLEEADQIATSLRTLRTSLGNDNERSSAEQEIIAAVRRQYPTHERLQDEYYALTPGKRDEFLKENPQVQAAWDLRERLREESGLFGVTEAARINQLFKYPVSEGSRTFAVSIGLDEERISDMTSYEVSQWIDRRFVEAANAAQLDAQEARRVWDKKREEGYDSLTEGEKATWDRFTGSLYVNEESTEPIVIPEEQRPTRAQLQYAVELGLNPQAAAIMTKQQISSYIDLARREEDKLWAEAITRAGVDAEEYSTAMEGYREIPEDDTEARRAYREAHPILQQVWDARNEMDAEELSQSASRIQVDENAGKPSQEQIEYAVELGLPPEAAVLMTKEQIGRWIGQAQAKRNQYWEQVFDYAGVDGDTYFSLLEEYNKLPEGSAARRVFRNNHPELIQVWNAQDVIEGNAEIPPVIGSSTESSNTSSSQPPHPGTVEYSMWLWNSR